MIITLNGQRVEAQEGEYILSACRRNNVEIPTLCWYPYIDPYAGCRLCVVEATEGKRMRMVTACNFPVRDGLVVETENPRVIQARKMAIELLMARSANAPVVQEYAARYGISESRFGHGEDLCILCGLCVRVCSELVGANAICFVGRGTDRKVSTPFEINAEACIGCGACAHVCPTGIIRVEDVGQEPGGVVDFTLGPQSAISIPFHQAVPKVPWIDPNACIRKQTSGCGICATVCEPKAINYDQQETTFELEVGQILVSTGFQGFDPSKMAQYGYGRLDDVLTSLEFERMLNSTGITGGKIRCKDGREPRAIGIIHCVGSRDEHHHRYCSRVCCMYGLKFAHLVKDRTASDVFQFYIDMRAFGKGYEEFYSRVLHEGTTVIRGKGAEVVPAPAQDGEAGKLIIRCEDTLLNEYREIPVDMVVLCIALEPQDDAEQVARLFSLSRSPDGFFLERHPKLDPVGTNNEGMYIAGTCQSPKDIPDTVAQAQAAAARILGLIGKGEVLIDPIRAEIDEKKCSGCRICNNVCPYQAVSFDSDKKISQVNETVCKGCGTCVAACPAGAITGIGFTDRQILAELEALLI